MIYSIHEGLFDRFKKKDKEEDKSVKVYHYITGKDFNDAKSTFTGCTTIESISNYLSIHNVNYSNKTIIVPDNNKSVLNIGFVIYKVPFDKCTGNKYLHKFNGSKEDAIEVFNGTLDEYIKKNNLKIKYFTPLFKDINECKSTIKRVLSALNTEFKNIKGAGVYKFQDLDEDDIKQFFEGEGSNEYLWIGSMNATESEYDDKDNTFYELIDTAIEKANDKIKNTGLYIDQDWDKWEGTVFLCYKKSVSESTIFSEVKFMHEGVLGGILAMISLPIILITITAAGCKISNISERSRIQKVLKNALENDKNLESLKNKLKRGTRVISVNRLAQQVSITDKDIDIIKKNDISVLTMVDKNNNIIAYCLVNPIERKIQYGYTIIDKSLPKSKTLEAFIKATFEFKIGIYGEGIKYFTNQPKNRFIYEPSKNAHEIGSKANYLSKEESKLVYKRIEDFSETLYNILKKGFVPGVEVDDITDYGNYVFYINLYNEELSNSNDTIDDEYEEYYNKNEDLITKCNNALTSIMKKLGFNIINDYYRSDNDDYKFIKVSSVTSDEELGYYSIRISSSKALNLE